MLSKTNLNFVSINAKGLNISHKRATILDFFRKKKVDFAMVQESHFLSKDVRRFANKFYHSIASSSASTKTGGVMVVCKRSLKFDLIGSWSDTEGRIAVAKIQMDGRSLVSAYAPNTFDSDFYKIPH